MLIKLIMGYSHNFSVVHGKHSFLDQCFIIYVQLSLFFFLLITEKNNQNTFQQQEIVKKNSVCMCVHVCFFSCNSANVEMV